MGCVGNILLELSREKKITSVPLELLFVNAHSVSMGISPTDQLPPSYKLNLFQLQYISSRIISLQSLVVLHISAHAPAIFILQIKGRKAKHQLYLNNKFCICSGPPQFVVKNSGSCCFVRTVRNVGASSRLAPSSSFHFLPGPVKVRRATNLNRGRFHRTVGGSRTIRQHNQSLAAFLF